MIAEKSKPIYMYLSGCVPVDEKYGAQQAEKEEKRKRNKDKKKKKKKTKKGYGWLTMGDRAGETQPSCSWTQFRATGIQKSSSTLLLVARNPDFLSLNSMLHVTTRYSTSYGQVKVAHGQVTWLTYFTMHSICSHPSFEGILPTAILPREDKQCSYIHK